MPNISILSAFRGPFPLIAAICAMAACQSTAPDAESFTSVITPITTSGASGVQVTRGFGPPDADPASCYGREVEPAVIETVTEQILVAPAELDADGGILRPASFVTETEQRMVAERREIWFETPCEIEANPGYIASLQRALAARGLYDGEITGVLDPATIDAIRVYQQPQGLDSGVLSLAAARQLGLSVWDPVLAAGGGRDG